MRKKRFLAWLLAGIMTVSITGTPDFSIRAEEGVEDSESEIIGNDENGIPDVNLYNAVLRQCDNNQDGELSRAEAEACTWCDLAACGIENIQGIQYLSNLEYLDLSNNSISDFSSVSGLENLRHLYLSCNAISDISSLEGLENLEALYLSGNEISDISSLKGLENLQTLYLDYNEISDFSDLEGLENLRYLSLDYNEISDISSLKGLENLQTLYLGNNEISDISSLSGMENLQYLYLDNNAISISSLEGLENLRYLSLGNNEISDISSLEGLENLQYLYLGNNKISDISSLSGMENLQYLYLNNNVISDISSLTELTSLSVLNLTYNEISDLTCLKDSALITAIGEYCRSRDYIGDYQYCFAAGNQFTKEAALEIFPEELIYMPVYGTDKVWIDVEFPEDDVDDILQQLETAEDGATVEVALENSTILSAEVLNAMQDRDITLNLTVENDTVWRIRGTELPSGELGDMDFSVVRTGKEEGNISVNKITELAGEREAEQLIFGQAGEFGFSPQLTLTVSERVNGNKGVVLQSKNGMLELAASVLIAENAITFDVKSGADSVIIYGRNGDTNGDGNVDIKDMMQLLHHISGSEEMNAVQNGFADVDVNDVVNVQDLMRELNYVSGRSDSL